MVVTFGAQMKIFEDIGNQTTQLNLYIFVGSTFTQTEKVHRHLVLRLRIDTPHTHHHQPGVFHILPFIKTQVLHHYPCSKSQLYKTQMWLLHAHYRCALKHPTRFSNIFTWCRSNEQIYKRRCLRVPVTPMISLQYIKKKINWLNPNASLADIQSNVPRARPFTSPR